MTNGVPQGSLVGPLIFSFLKNELHESPKYSDLKVSADDLKILAIDKTKKEIQSDLNAISN